MGGTGAAVVAASKHRPAKHRRHRGRLSLGRRGNPACPDGSEVAIAVREGPSPHQKPPPRGGRENSLRVPRRGREDLPILSHGEKENSRDAGVAEVVDAAAVRGPAVHKIRAVRQIRAAARARIDVASTFELAGIEWSGGALA